MVNVRGLHIEPVADVSLDFLREKFVWQVAVVVVGKVYGGRRRVVLDTVVGIAIEFLQWMAQLTAPAVGPWRFLLRTNVLDGECLESQFLAGAVFAHPFVAGNGQKWLHILVMESLHYTVAIVGADSVVGKRYLFEMERRPAVCA